MNNKRGQLTIFIIIAVVIIAIIILLWVRPKISVSPGGAFSPRTYLKSCIEPSLIPEVTKLANQGGYSNLNGSGSLEYQGDLIKYLCYTSSWYSTCVVQEPMIKEHFEGELNTILKSKMDTCFANLKQEYENQGYTFSSGKVSSKVSFAPGNIIVSYDAPITVSKGGVTSNFKGFNTTISSQMYDLLMLSVSVIDYEQTYGDSAIELYMQYYPDLKMEKTKLSDGSKIYRLTNVVSNESFRFASRSLSWPPGFPE